MITVLLLLGWLVLGAVGTCLMWAWHKFICEFGVNDLTLCKLVAGSLLGVIPLSLGCFMWAMEGVIRIATWVFEHRRCNFVLFKGTNK